MGSPIIPSFEPTQDDLSDQGKVKLSRFPYSEKYQDTKMTVRKYSPSAKELANGTFWGPSMGSEINKQVRIGKINGFRTVAPWNDRVPCRSSGPSK
jgi:hypothetical protein